MIISSRRLLGLAALCFALNLTAAPTDPLATGFLNPPNSAKPQTWWHWMNGNITQAGITADLEAMKQIGLGGATIVNVDCGIPRGDVPFMSPMWRADFKFAVQEAARLNLKLCVENCAGWSSSGGPWNTPTNAMQELTASETRAHGPTLFDETLPQPPMKLGFYRDVAVLAFPAPVIENDEAGNDVPATKAKLIIKHATYGADGGASTDVTAKIVELAKIGRKAIMANSDELGGDPAPGQVKQLHVDFILNGTLVSATVDEGDTLVFPTNSRQLAKKHSFTKSSVDRTFVQPPPANAFTDGGTIPRADMLDLTSKLTADGHLKWQVPAGDWVILRVGYTPTGVNNHPAPAEGEGLECDKFSKSALDEHWNGFMQKILDDIGPLAGKSLDTSLIDSYEVGGQDWTKNFRSEFKKRRGYDPLKFLPVFTRHVVDSPEVTERFLWDMRRTIADLFADNYFGHFAELCRQHGLFNAVEPYTGPFESLQCGGPADVVMGEFWSGSQGHPSVKMAASIAHIYGKTIVGAESFTAAPDAGRWQNDPYSLKTLGDLMYCQGLNRYIFHRYAMQPWTNHWPGMTMGQWGFHFERTETWWHDGKAWIDYISHCEFLLQQGRAVADAAYFTGESAPVEMRIGNPTLPVGYDYDAVNADVLLHGATVKNGRITLASGASYAVLILPENDTNLTPDVLQCLRKLVRAGATIVGPRPQHSPSLMDYPNCDQQVKKMADELWNKCDGTQVLENSDGKGRVIWGKSLSEIFAAQRLAPDFEVPDTAKTSKLAYVHRVANGSDIYFVSNQRRRFDSVDCTFRVNSKIPELWHPDTGVIEPAPIWKTQGDRTTVRLTFDPAGSVFVIFRQAATGADHVIAASSTMAAPAAKVPQLKIQHAVYGAVDGSGETDVTAKLTDLVDDNQLVVSANNDSMGGDPASLHVKELRLDYTLDDQPFHKTVAEGETLAMPPMAAAGQPPQWETKVAPDGATTVKAWSDGQIELQTAQGKTLHATAADLPAPQEIFGTWNVSFPPNWGAPPLITLDKLISWTEYPNDGVRYFSGTAAYDQDIQIQPEQLSAGRELWLDLGAVKNFAEVSLNGQDLGILWKPPFRLNVTSAAKPGVNHLTVKITNLWPNRLIGDEQLPSDREWDGKQLKAWPQWFLDGKPSPTGRLTFTTWHHWGKNSPLLESGLLGPVTLRTAEIIPAK
ncbi:MAG TPA: glycosyl hydrolase [Verrucomicrobiae bacterium]|jgi:hypothetical protein